MNKKILLCAILALICFIEESYAREKAPPTKEVIVKAGEVYHGMKFPEGTKLQVYIHNNEVSSGELSQNFKMTTHLIRKDTSFWIHGEDLFEIQTVEGQKINDVEFALGEAMIRFRTDGSILTMHLNKLKKIQGALWAANSNLEFFPNSKVNAGSLEGDQAVDTLNLKGGTELSFYPSGKIKGAKLSKESTWQHYTIRGEEKFNTANLSDVDFWPNGKLQNAILAREVEKQGYYCGAGEISFFESGQLKSCVLSRKKKVIFNPYPGQAPHEQLVKPRESVNFNEQGVAIGWAGSRGMSGIHSN